MYFKRKATFSFTKQRLAYIHTSFIWIWSAALSFMWFFHVGSGSLLQKNCTIWTISKGHAFRITPKSHLLQYSQIVQPPEPKQKTSYTTSWRSSTFALLSCHFLFLTHYTLSFRFCELSYKAKKEELCALLPIIILNFQNSCSSGWCIVIHAGNYDTSITALCMNNLAIANVHRYMVNIFSAIEHKIPWL